MNIVLLNASPKNNGATQEILQTVQETVPEQMDCELLCLGDFNIQYCLGCKKCYNTCQCVRRDEMGLLLDKIDAADILVIAAPSYWADVPGQFKVFIDRCTPFGNTNPNPGRKALREGKRCYAIALRTGSRPAECQHIINTIEHWCGHMGIEMADSMYFCGIEDNNDIVSHKPDIRRKAMEWFRERRLDGGV